MAKKEKVISTVGQITNAVAAIQKGCFTRRIKKKSVSFLQPIVDSINHLAITLEAQAQESASCKNKFLETVLSSLPGLVSYIDRDLRYLYVNSAYQKWFGVSREQCLKSTIKDVIGESGLKAVQYHLEAAFRGVQQDFECEVSYKHIGTKRIRVQHIPDKDHSGSTRGIIALIHDVTKEKDALEGNELAETRMTADRARLRALISQSTDAIMTLSPPTWKFTGCNPAALKLFEVPNEDTFVSLGPWDLSAEKQPDGALSSDKAPEMIMNAMKSGRLFFEWDHKTLSGKIINCNVLLSRIDVGGKCYLQATVRDVSKEREALVKLRKKTEELNSIYSKSPIGILELDCNLRIKRCNPAYQAMLEYTEDELVGRSILDLTHPDDKNISQLKAQSIAFEGGQLNRLEKRFISKTGKIVWAAVVSRVLNDGVAGFRYLSMITDVTEQIQLRQELEFERAKTLRSAKLASLGEMSAGIAHEINNPLAIISGSIGLLEKFAENPEKIRSKIETIKKSCDRIARIVGGLRKFSRTGEKANLKNYDLSKIIQDASILTEAKSKRHSTLVTIDSNSRSPVLCDEVEIEQVLVNLINNAIDAVKTKPEKWVKVTLFDDANSVVIKVTDSGTGIPENVRNKLFEPFFTTKEVGEGTGLGLSITKGILDEHKATITVVTDSPNTCFEIRFPKAAEIKHAA